MFRQPPLPHMSNKSDIRPARKVVIQPYDPGWPEKFAKEAACVSRALGLLTLQIYHIGSTAIPGIFAKPILDILAVVSNLDAVDALKGTLKAENYVSFGEYGIRGRKFFKKIQ